MDNTINELFVNAIVGGEPEGDLIQVQFYNRPDLIEYPARIMDLLKNDPHVRDIIDASTGEVIFTRDNF